MSCPVPCCQATGLATNRKTLALVGNPNCGKTTIFNALTGSNQRVGNWPGVTVECKRGTFMHQSSKVDVIDLPGVYSLSMTNCGSAIDEKIACDFISRRGENGADVIINIVDASQLERHLYLTLQLIEMGAPIVLAINMMDVARSNQIQIDTATLSKRLGCLVIALEAHRSGGIEELKNAVLAYQPPTSMQTLQFFPPQMQTAITNIAATLGTGIVTKEHEWLALRLFENDDYVHTMLPSNLQVKAQAAISAAKLVFDSATDVMVASARYAAIDKIIADCQQTKSRLRLTWTARIDQIVLNRFLGIPIFLGMMYLLFLFAINVGGAFQDFFDITSQTLFVEAPAHLLNYFGAPSWLIALIANGIGKGINTTVTFIPVIGAMFFFLSLLEDTGYMARAAFIVDRAMRFIGLPGKAFVPMVVGFGCNVPAVMAARTLENKRDRILTIMMSPFMSCGARLAIYAIFTAAFFPHGGQNIVFALYFLGILIAVLTGLLLRLTVLKGESAPLVMELPRYHLPLFKNLYRTTLHRLKGFVIRAGKLIVPICMLIGVLNAINIDGTLNNGDANAQSLLSYAGQLITPIFTPLGITAQNWPATVGLLAGVLAKEVVVGTLNTLYTQVGHLTLATVNAGGWDFWANISQALHSIPNNIANLRHAFSNPIVAQAPIASDVSHKVYGVMYQYFDGKIGAFAYLLFILLYFPCVSTLAVMLRELHRGWGIFSAVWSTLVAYGVAVFFYQAATLPRHPLSSIIWLVGIVAAFAIFILAIRQLAERKVVKTFSQPAITL